MVLNSTRIKLNLFNKSISEIIQWKSVPQVNTTFLSVGYIGVHEVFVERIEQL